MASYHGSYRAAPVSDLSHFTCTVCMNLFYNPTRISCGNRHVYCRECVINLQPVEGKFLCPACRTPFKKDNSIPANDIDILLKSSIGQCQICSAQMDLLQLRDHQDQCGQSAAASLSSQLRFKPIKETSQPVPQPGPNRMTFCCPYCNQPNLDSKDMVEHCNSMHFHDRRQVVCPICTSMPWGDPNLVSINFMQHLNTRHKFEYDTYVDYDQDDDAMLRAAIAASLEHN